MPPARLAPGTTDALLFDLGRVVLDIDFSKAIACWAAHSGRKPSDLVARFVRDDIYRQHEIGRIDDAAYFDSLRASLGIGISDDQFLEGWNAIFAGEMPGIAPLLARALRLLQHQPAACRAFLQRLCRPARPFPSNLFVFDNRASETGRGGL
jgi:putative hydrolase of the HAD superfamily